MLKASHHVKLSIKGTDREVLQGCGAAKAAVLALACENLIPTEEMLKASFMSANSPPELAAKRFETQVAAIFTPVKRHPAVDVSGRSSSVSLRVERRIPSPRPPPRPLHNVPAPHGRTHRLNTIASPVKLASFPHRQATFLRETATDAA